MHVVHFSWRRKSVYWNCHPSPFYPIRTSSNKRSSAILDTSQTTSPKRIKIIVGWKKKLCSELSEMTKSISYFSCPESCMNGEDNELWLMCSRSLGSLFFTNHTPTAHGSLVSVMGQMLPNWERPKHKPLLRTILCVWQRYLLPVTLTFTSCCQNSKQMFEKQLPLLPKTVQLACCFPPSER